MHYEHAMRQVRRLNIHQQESGIVKQTLTNELMLCAAEWGKLSPQGRRYAARAAKLYYNALCRCNTPAPRAWCRAMGYFRQMILSGGVR